MNKFSLFLLNIRRVFVLFILTSVCKGLPKFEGFSFGLDFAEQRTAL